MKIIRDIWISAWTVSYTHLDVYKRQDWGSPETLEHWREAWAEMCNAKFAEKGIDVRIDHRSYERQGVELLPTIHAVSYTHL